ncbi:MAG: Gfo/Idh/MocA family oxidoreductase, partial [Leptolyngbya sp. SIO1D8]|nr:Gfo/Idh/MocA family oxidoreductase [Leptolyngbya sp. SIO1D8]
MRIEAFKADERSEVVAIAGKTPEQTLLFAQPRGIAVSQNWQLLIERDDVDLIGICHVNAGHGEVVRAALMAGKSVVVEYPLSLSPTDATELIALAQRQRSLLHIEHIELLGGLHQAMQAHLPDVGTPSYVRYCTAAPRNPAPEKWTYDAAVFGFPLAGALSRMHRLTHLFGPVHQVSSHVQYDGVSPEPPMGYFKNCRCVAHLRFYSGVVAEVLYAKGEQTWRSQRWMEVVGDHGALVFDGNEGTLTDILFTVFEQNVDEIAAIYENICLPHNLVLILNPVFEYNEVKTGEKLSAATLKALRYWGKKKWVYLNNAFITLRQDGG